MSEELSNAFATGECLLRHRGLSFRRPSGANLPKRDCHRPRVEFRHALETLKPHVRILILNWRARLSKRKTTRGALERTRPSKPASSRTEKARNLPVSQRLSKKRRRSRRQPCFRAAVPIWDGNRGDSRGDPSNLHTFLCIMWVGFCRPTSVLQSWVALGRASLIRDFAELT